MGRRFLHATFLLGLLLFSGSIQAQEEVENLPDSILIENYLDEALRLMYTDPDSAFLLSVEAVKMSEELKYYKLSAQGLMNLAGIYSIRGDYTEALQNDLHVLELAKDYNDSSLLATALINVGDDHLAVRNFNAAYDHFVSALGIAEALGEELELDAVIAIFNMGEVLKELGQYEGALARFQESLDRGIEAGDDEGIIHANNEIGHTYFLMSNFADADVYFKKALDKTNTLSVPDVKAQLLERYALNLLHLDQPQTAKEILNESLKIGEDLKNIDLQAKAYNGLATMSYFIKDYPQAEGYVQQSLALTTDSNLKKTASESYRLMYLIENNKRNFEKALQHFRDYHRLNDELMEEEKNVQITNLQLEYDLERKDFEITDLNNREILRLEQLQKQRLLRNVLVVLLTFSMILLYAVYRSGQRRRKINELLIEHREEVMQQKNELDELNKLKDKFFSILAHDLRSPLRSLAGVLKLLETENLSKEDSQKLVGAIARRTEETQTLLDNLLEWALIQMNKINVVKTEFELKSLVDKNIKFFRETNDKPIHIDNQVGDCKAYADKNMIDLVMRNLISNAIKYTDEGGEISVGMDQVNGDIHVHISDNGVGVSEDLKKSLLADTKMIRNAGTAEDSGTGLGLKISKEFVERNGGEIWLESTKGIGSKFSFSLPIKPLEPWAVEDEE